MVAFDHMSIKFSQLEWAYTLLDIYQKFFKNDDNEDKGEEQKTDSSQNKRKMN